MCYCVRCTVPSGPLSVLANTWGLSEAISNGLARDGGLYVPKHSLPKPTFGQMKRLVPLLYKHKAHIVLEKLIHHSQVIHYHLINSIISFNWSDDFVFKNRYCLKKLMKLSMLPLAPFIIQLLYQLLIWSKVKFILLNFFMDQLVLLKIWHFNCYPDWFWIFYCPMKSMCIWWLPLVTRVASIFNVSFSKI